MKKICGRCGCVRDLAGNFEDLERSEVIWLCGDCSIRVREFIQGKTTRFQE